MADDIGARLREARMRAKIDINEVELRTKIRAKYLRAIENEEWDLLPGDIYVKSFLRTYGDYLGLDTRQLLDDYRRRYERPSDHELRPIAPPGRERERRARRRGFPPWAAVVVVLVAVAVALYFVGRNGPKTPTTTPTTSTQAAAGRHRTRPGGHRKAGASKAKAKTVKLTLVATGPVYVCLVSGTGQKLIGGEIFNVGQTIPTETASKLLLTLGNASVKMTVNGHLVAVAPSSSSIGYELVPGGHTLLAPAQQPQCT
ncbi:MAG: helix-turn-helix domain-containing protein [Solirubrobacteraceae bacterium]|jgi:cytoskeletal protein RodZ